MKHVFTFILFIAATSFVAGQNVLVADFDEISSGFAGLNSGSATGEVEIVPNPDGAGNVGKIIVTGNNSDGAGFFFDLDNALSRDDYESLRLDVKSTHNNISFIPKLEREEGGNTLRVQDWATYRKYSGAGEWQTVHVPFEVMQASTEHPTFQFTRIVLLPDPWGGSSLFEMYIDNVTLVSKGSGVNKNSIDNINLFTSGGQLMISNVIKDTKVKIYSITGVLVYEGNCNNDFELDMRSIGVSNGIVLVNLSDGTSSSVTKKVMIK